MKKIVSIFLLVVISVTMLIIPLTAQAKEAAYVGSTVVEESISPRADVIVIKYRVYNGYLQFRRWNETWGYWVDPMWMTIGEYPGD